MIYIIGSGIAGLTAAVSLRSKGQRVAVITKKALGGSSPMSLGGIAAATSPDDTPELHALDTIKVGDGLCDVKAVTYFTKEAPRAIEAITNMGFKFDGDLRLEGGHSKRRVHHSADSTGRALTEFLLRKAREHGVILVEDRVIEIRSEDGAVKTVVTEGGLKLNDVDAVVLATGGYAYLWQYTSNPPENIGEGIALAFRAGAVVGDLEFIQFHPTLALLNRETILLTETLRGEGAILVNDLGERFAFRYHKDGELAPRDVLARAVYDQYKRGRKVYMDLRPIDNFEQKFPSLSRLLKAYGLDKTSLIQVFPGAHFTIGGVRVNVKGESTVRRLYAIGEAADTGLHGANRLASNSLLEALVMGLNLADYIGDKWEGPDLNDGEIVKITIGRGGRDADLEDIRELNWRYLGLERDEEGLSKLARIYMEMDLGSPSARSAAALTSYLAATAALLRRESRGAHYRVDYPYRDERFRRRIYFSL